MFDYSGHKIWINISIDRSLSVCKFLSVKSSQNDGQKPLSIYFVWFNVGYVKSNKIVILQKDLLISTGVLIRLTKKSRLWNK